MRVLACRPSPRTAPGMQAMSATTALTAALPGAAVASSASDIAPSGGGVSSFMDFLGGVLSGPAPSLADAVGGAAPSSPANTGPALSLVSPTLLVPAASTDATLPQPSTTPQAVSALADPPTPLAAPAPMVASGVGSVADDEQSMAIPQSSLGMQTVTPPDIQGGLSTTPRGPASQAAPSASAPQAGVIAPPNVEPTALKSDTRAAEPAPSLPAEPEAVGGASLVQAGAQVALVLAQPVTQKPTQGAAAADSAATPKAKSSKSSKDDDATTAALATPIIQPAPVLASNIAQAVTTTSGQSVGAPDSESAGAAPQASGSGQTLAAPNFDALQSSAVGAVGGDAGDAAWNAALSGAAGSATPLPKVQSGSSLTQASAAASTVATPSSLTAAPAPRTSQPSSTPIPQTQAVAANPVAASPVMVQPPAGPAVAAGSQAVAPPPSSGAEPAPSAAVAQAAVQNSTSPPAATRSSNVPTTSSTGAPRSSVGSLRAAAPSSAGANTLSSLSAASGFQDANAAAAAVDRDPSGRAGCVRRPGPDPIVSI